MKTYKVIKEVELKVLNRIKLFKEGVEYEYDVFVKTYPDKFVSFGTDLAPKEIILDCGNSVYDENVLDLDLNNIHQLP